jgi:hypothetical protein
VVKTLWYKHCVVNSSAVMMISINRRKTNEITDEV